MIKIWQKYLLKKISILFTTFLLFIFGLYCILDFSITGLSFYVHNNPSLGDLLLYYCYQFSSLLNILCPFAFLLAILKTMLDLNSSNELITLQMAGISLRKILVPFFIIATALTCINYANQEWIAPNSQTISSKFRKETKKKKRNTIKLKANHLSLDDESSLIYLSREGEELFDVFWVKNNKEFWHMKYLTFEGKQHENKTGRFVDQFVRNEQGFLEKSQSYELRNFPEIPLDINTDFNCIIPIEKLSLSKHIYKALHAKKSHINLTYLQYKLAFPLIHFLCLFALSPLCMIFSRTRKNFLITSLAIALFFSFCTILEGMVILAESKILSSFVAIWGPLFIGLVISLKYFLKLGKLTSEPT